MPNILDQIVETMPIYQEAFPVDVCIVVCDLKTVYGYLSGKKIDLKLEIGKSLEYYRESAAVKVLETKQRIQKEVGEEFLGIPYIVTATPILESGKLIGSISICSSNEEVDMMRKNSERLDNLLGQMAHSLDEIVIASNETAHYSVEISEESNTILDDLTKIDQILFKLQKNAVQAKILGLNAAIEAAKSKDQNGGFMIVANEIKKMSEQTQNFSKEINSQLKEISRTVEAFHYSIQKISSYTQEHAANVQLLKETLAEIKKMASKYKNKQ